MSRVFQFRRKRLSEARSQRGRTVRSRWQALLTLILFGAVFSLVAVAVAAVVIYKTYANDLQPPEELIADTRIDTSLAYDRNGEPLFEFIDPLGSLRNPVPLDEISPYLIAATIATEDASFYDNPGVNIRGLLRAITSNLPEPLGEGWGKGSGGSSITQQLVKNVYISPEERFDRKAERKIKETVIALELKRKYSDDQILTWYLNQLDYANHAFGAEAAAQRYFGKHAKDLTLAEAAMLAGIPQAPGLYTPVLPENRERAKARQEEVLDLMLKHADQIEDIVQVTPEQIEAAKQEELKFAPSSFEIKAPHFVFYLEEQVTKMCEEGRFEPPEDIPCDKVVYWGGLRITSTLDMGLQQIGEQTVEETISANEEQYGGHDGALVAIRPETGEILAYVGSRDFFREDIQGQVDIATSLKSHGSTMKVFTYLTAFEQGWVPSTIVRDAPLMVGTGEYEKIINNWNFTYLGDITVRKAMAESVNVAAVNTVMEVGIGEMQKMAHRMGITDLRRDDCGPTITLGSCEVKLLDMTYAFSALANNGVMKGWPTLEELPEGFRKLDPVSVLKIEDATGKVLYQYSAPEERQVIDPAYAYMITDILSRDAIEWSRLTIGRPAASKTGTSEDFRDNVVMGYTPDLAAGVWMGNADNTPMVEGTFSSAGTGPMWKRFMQEAHAYLELPPRSFAMPGNVVTARCSDSDERQELFVQNQEPTKPGACRPPFIEGDTPKFPPRATPTTSPTPTPSPAPSPSPSPMRTPTPTLKPTSSPAPSPTPAGQVSYIVLLGDTLQGTADKFGISLQALLEANGLKVDSIIKPGDELIIPSAPGGQGGGGQGQDGGHELD